MSRSRVTGMKLSSKKPADIVAAIMRRLAATPAADDRSANDCIDG